MGEAAPEEARRRPSLLVLLPVVVFVLLAGLFAVRLGAGDPSRIPSALIGRKVPDFALPALAGIEAPRGGAVAGLSDEDLRGRGVTIVNVFASWCAPCRVEHPVLMGLAETDAVKQGKVALVGMNYKDKAEAASRFLRQLGNPFQAVGRDESGRVGIDWGVYGIPESYLVAPDGTILYKRVGPFDDAAPRWAGRRGRRDRVS